MNHTDFPVKNMVGEVFEPFHVRFQERVIESLQPDEILVRVRASAICGSDLHIARGKHPSAPLPVTIGHEFSGDVAAVGEHVTKFSCGQRVTVEPCIVCGKCPACRRGDYGYCENISYTYRNGDGAMADFVVVKEQFVYSLPDEMSYDIGALIEPLSVATHAVRRAKITLGDNVLVIGDGAIGLMVVAMSRLSGAERIIAAGHSDFRLQIAKELGADSVINTKRCCLEKEIEKFVPGGVEKSFECVGREECFLSAINSLKHNGTATIVGIYEDQNLHFAPAKLITHELHIQGAQGYCWDFQTAIAAAQSIPLNKLISRKYPLSQLQEALDTALSRDNTIIKVLISNDEKDNQHEKGTSCVVC